jgi:hypothetical protein
MNRSRCVIFAAEFDSPSRTERSRWIWLSSMEGNIKNVKKWQTVAEFEGRGWAIPWEWRGKPAGQVCV